MKQLKITPLRMAVHLGGWAPLAWLLYRFYSNDLTANPIQAIEQITGIQALTFLLLSLACTPGASVLGWKELTQRRKALGNYGFLYAVLHVFTFFVIDYSLDLASILKDVGTKWYILIGAAAFLMLLPLAITSYKYWMKRLGKNWKRLHKLVYIISPLVVIHFALVVKGSLSQLQGNLGQPILYGGIALLLLAMRIPAVKKMLIGVRSRVRVSFQAAVSRSK